MLGIDQELEELYKEAQINGEAVIKDRRIAKNYGCCSANSPMSEKYRIKYSENEISLFIWSDLAVSINRKTNEITREKAVTNSNYDKKIIDWFIERTQTL